MVSSADVFGAVVSSADVAEVEVEIASADVVEVMVALPGQLFFNTQIPACLWFLAKQKKRKGEVLFIDARKQATMISRVQSELTDEVIERISHSNAKEMYRITVNVNDSDAEWKLFNWASEESTSYWADEIIKWVKSKVEFKKDTMW